MKLHQLVPCGPFFLSCQALTNSVKSCTMQYIYFSPSGDLQTSMKDNINSVSVGPLPLLGPFCAFHKTDPRAFLLHTTTPLTASVKDTQCIAPVSPQLNSHPLLTHIQFSLPGTTDTFTIPLQRTVFNFLKKYPLIANSQCLDMCDGGSIGPHFLADQI